MPGAYVDIATWLQVQMVFAGIQLCGAPYFQCKVWAKIQEEIQLKGLANGPPPIQVPSEVVHESFRTVFLHDFGVLAFAIILVAAYFWSECGAAWIASGT